MSASPQFELLFDLVALHVHIQKRLVGPLSCHGISLSEDLVLRQLLEAPGKRLRRADLARGKVGLSPSRIPAF